MKRLLFAANWKMHLAPAAARAYLQAFLPAYAPRGDREVWGAEIGRKADLTIATLGANLAFRPRPTLDFQLEIEFPVWERVEGTQLEQDLQLMFTVGYRI